MTVWAPRLTIAAIVFALLFFALSWEFWGPEFGQFPVCLFEKADCSQAVATYAQVFVTAIALCAAIAAANWAFRTYEMEQGMILSQRPCTAIDHDDAMLTYHIEDQKVLAGKPPILDQWSYVALDSELESLGRSAVIATGLGISVSLARPDGISELDPSTFEQRAEIDIRLRSDGSVHFRIYLRYPLVNAGASVYLLKPSSETKNSFGREVEYRMMDGGMRSDFRVLLPLDSRLLNNDLERDANVAEGDDA